MVTLCVPWSFLVDSTGLRRMAGASARASLHLTFLSDKG